MAEPAPRDPPACPPQAPAHRPKGARGAGQRLPRCASCRRCSTTPIRLAKWLCRNADDAQDIVQEAAVRALKALETTAVDRPKPWFLAIVRNAAITWMARNRRKDLAFAGGLDDLDALAPADGDAAPDAEATLIAARGRRRG